MSGGGGGETTGAPGDAAGAGADTTSMLGKTVIVTGANSGIGRATAVEVARRGGRVIMACRDMERGQEVITQTPAAISAHLVLKHLDLASLRSVRAFCSSILELYKNGDINFEDLGSEQTYDKAFAYGRSKLANLLFVSELAQRLEGSGVTVNGLTPGIVRTNLGRHVHVPLLAKPLFSLLSHAVFKSPEEGARTSVHLACSADVEGVHGECFADCRPQVLLPKATDQRVARKLWDISEVMVGVTT